MDFWRLLSPAAADGTLLIGHHNPWVGGAAFFLAVVGASVLVPAVNRYRGHQHRYVWLLGGALTMGLGFWGMHFASMLAYHLPVIHGYDRTHSLLSMVPVIVACGLCIFLCSFNRSPPYHVVLAALVLGVGIAGTHFWGMEAMRLPVAMHYKPGLFFVSLLAAFVLPLGALLSVHWLRKKVSHHSNALPLVATLAVGLSVCAFHILAMSATYFVVTDPSVLVTTHPVPRGLMAAIVLVAILVVLLLIGLLLDRRWVDLSQSLARSEQRFTRMAQNSGVAIFTYNQTGVAYANPALSAILGYDKQEIESLPLAEILGQACADFALGAISGAPAEGENFQSQFEVTTKSGHVRWIYLSISVERKCQALIGLASGFDITSQKLAESNYRKLAYKDSLTRLANRAMFIDRVEHHLALLNRRGGKITSCILLIDLDKFKVTNDTLGHAYGDQLLQAVGERLLACSRSSDTVARLGGDEFVILAEGAEDIYDIQAIAEKIIDEFKTPVEVGVQQVQVELSMGALPIVPKAYNCSDDVLRDADIAMYRAKKVNGSYWVIFNEELDASARRMRQLQIELKQTIEQGSLQFFYQPIIDISEQRVVGFESLARWQRETGEWVSPAEFIPLAERSGSVSDIGLWALKRAAEQVAQWSARFNRRDIYISINIAAVSFGDERFYQLLDEMFAQYDLAPGQIRVELTERILMENAEMVMPKLEKLLQMGCNLMLDDFGTGYSSLSYLHRLPINTVKIDRSFIENLNQDQQAPAIVKSIVGLAENLNMSVISEGVETPQQSAQLLDLGCQVVQGFLYSKPMPPEAAEAYYEQYNSTGNIVSDDSLASSMV